MPGDNAVEEIKTKLDIVQVVSDYLQLKKAGINFKAPCPFHSEKTPSFFVSPDRQTWHCFGCNEGGDMFSFVMRMEGLDFKDALKHLAQKAGVELKRYDGGGDNKGRERALEANKLAASFFHQMFLKSHEAEVARAYAAKRGLKPETIEEFQIGYALPAWDGLLLALKKRGFSGQELVSAGLVIFSQDKNKFFDRFRHRFMFPIRDAQGNVVAFTGRIMPGPDGKDPPKEAKYVNSPETEIYRKSNIIFALDAAKQAIRKAGFAVVVEGNMDATASHQAGVKNVVASSGTAFTAEHLKRLERLTNKLVLSFDMDEAGQTAARRSIDAAVAEGFEVRVLRLPPDAGKDPDDCIRKNPELWKKAIADAVPFMQWHFETASIRTDRKDPYAKRRAEAQLLSEIRKLPSAAEQTHWLKELSGLYGSPEVELREEMRHLPIQTATAAESSPKSVIVVAKAADRHELVAQYLLGLALNWPEYAETIVAEVRPEWLDGVWRELYTRLVIAYNERRTGGPTTAPVRFGTYREADIQAEGDLALLAQKEFGDLPDNARREQLGKLIGEIKRLHISRRQRELTAAMKSAEQAHDAAAIQDIERQLNELIV
ncbi:MAG: DNA primase [Patescibacteria group bacterium]|nr:DNA primase [Patescibacteria group bacterium]